MRARSRAWAGGWRADQPKPLSILSAFLADPPAGYVEAAVGAAGSVELIGRLEHDEVAELLPHAEALVMPSTFPEAFGMVAVEAGACGALPVSAEHSGMREVSRQLAAELPEASRPADLLPGQGGRGRGDCRAPQRLAGAARGEPGERHARRWSRRSAGCGAGRAWPAG